MPGTKQRRRGTGRKFGTTKHQLKYNGNQYVNKCYTLELQAGSYQQQLQDEQQQALAARNREQVLIDMVLHQDLVLGHIQQQQQQQAATLVQQEQPHLCASAAGSSSAGGAGDSISSSASSSSPQDVPLAAAAAAAAALLRHASLDADDTSDCSYVASFLRHATAEQLHQVHTWDVDDWLQYWRSSYAQLELLLEAATQEVADAAAAQQALPSTDGCACGVSSCIHVKNDMTLAAAAVTAAAAGLGPCMLQLAELVDDVETLTFLAEIHNHLPLFGSAVINMDTGERGAPARQQRVEVAQRLALTPWQVHVLGAALAEFERLSQDHRKEGSALLSSANKPGWLFAEAVQQTGKSTREDSTASSPAAAAEAAAAAAADVVEAQEDAVPAAAEAAGSSSAADGRAGLDRQLGRHVNLRLLHMVSLHMFMANTLTRVQLAHMLVGSYPWGPIATAISEAVAMAAAPAPAAAAHATGSAAASAGPWELYQQQHEAARASMLSKQQQRWWQEVGQCFQALGGSRALQQLLQL